MTASAQDIRKWAREKEMDLDSKGRIPQSVRDAYNEDHGIEDPDKALFEDAEKPPNVAAGQSTLDKARAALESARERAKSKPATSGSRGTRSRPKAKKPRVSTETVISTLWGWAGRLTREVNLPVARVLTIQAPVAGMILEEHVKNTVADTVLQPLARLGKGSEVGMALLGPPILVAAIQARPESYEILKPLLRQSLYSWIRVAGPKIEEKVQQEREFEAEYGQSIDAMISVIFSTEDEEAMMYADAMRQAHSATESPDGFVPR